MRFINNKKSVNVQIATMHKILGPQILADFRIDKKDFMEFLDHVIKSCKDAYMEKELFIEA